MVGTIKDVESVAVAIKSIFDYQNKEIVIWVTTKLTYGYTDLIHMKVIGVETYIIIPLNYFYDFDTYKYATIAGKEVQTGT